MWEVVGFEKALNDAGEVESYNVHLQKSFKEGRGEGTQCHIQWYRTRDHKYVPVVGDKVMLEFEARGKFVALTDIYKV